MKLNEQVHVAKYRFLAMHVVTRRVLARRMRAGLVVVKAG